MKILKIEASNIIGLQRAEIVCGQPITLIAGDNESGKSSTCDALSMALDGQPRRVKLKKDVKELLHNGAKKGFVRLLGAGDEVLGSFVLPKGEHQIGETLEKHPGREFLPLVLDTHAFAAMDDKTRRSTLFKLTGASAKPDYILGELKSAGCNMALAEQIIAIARSGFPAMVDEAKKRASDARAVWQQTTGEAWGSEKGADWELEIPHGPAVTVEQIEQAKADCHKTQHQIEEGLSFKGKLEAAMAAAAGYAARTAELQDKAGNLKRARAKLTATEKDLKQWQAEVERLTPAMAEANANAGGMKCPCCDATLKLEDGKLVEFKGAKADAKKTSDLALALQQAKDAVGTYTRTRTNDLVAVQTAEQAQRDLDAHLANKPEADQAKLDKTIEKIDELRVQLGKQQAKRDALAERFSLLENAATTNRLAADKHQQIIDWQAIAEQLAPTGIPSKLLQKALAPVNTALETMARMTGWSQPAITQEMTLTYGGRDYALCSESAKWRFDVMVTLVVAQLSGLKFAVIDRLDVLSLKHRPKLAGLLAKLTELGNLDSVILCGTMKAAPAMPPELHTQSLWIEKGVVLSEGIE